MGVAKRHRYGDLSAMASRKRGRAEMEAVEPTKAPSLLSQLRNMWEFANIMQFIFIFGKALKIDEDFDIEVCSLPAPHLLTVTVISPLSHSETYTDYNM